MLLPNAHIENLLCGTSRFIIKPVSLSHLPERLEVQQSHVLSAECQSLVISTYHVFGGVVLASEDPCMSCTLLGQQRSHVAARQMVSNTCSKKHPML